MTRIECATVQDLLPERGRGALDPDLAGTLDLHVAECDSCSAALALVDLLQVGAVEPPPGLAARIQAAVREDRERSARPAAAAAAPRARALRIPRPAWALASAAALVLALGTSLLLQRIGGPSDEEVWVAFFDGVRSVWVGGDGVVAGAPVLDGLEDLSEDALVSLLEELGG